jgi:hypothetical protein
MTILQQASFPMKLPCDILRYTPDLRGETLLSSMQTDCTGIASTNPRTLSRHAVCMAAKDRSTHLLIRVLSMYIGALDIGHVSYIITDSSRDDMEVTVRVLARAWEHEPLRCNTSTCNEYAPTYSASFGPPTRSPNCAFKKQIDWMP